MLLLPGESSFKIIGLSYLSGNIHHHMELPAVCIETKCAYYSRNGE